MALFLLRGHADTLTFHRDGVEWTIPISDVVISQALFETGAFAQEEVRALLQWLEDNDYLGPDKTVIVEIGANIGTSTIPFALKTNLRVLALEPDPDNFRLLQRNVVQNHLDDRISCRQTAVSNQPGQLKMVVNPMSTGHSQVLEDQDTPSDHLVIEVCAERLDDILRAQHISPQEIAFVWSDTEGFERQVIESGRSLWSAGVPLFVEVWPPGLRNHGGIEQLATTMVENFERMLPSADLKSQGAGAVTRPVSQLQDYIVSVDETGTEVLLLGSKRI